MGESCIGYEPHLLRAYIGYEPIYKCGPPERGGWMRKVVRGPRGEAKQSFAVACS